MDALSYRVSLSICSTGEKEVLFSLELSADMNTHGVSSDILSLRWKRTASDKSSEPMQKS